MSDTIIGMTVNVLALNYWSEGAETASYYRGMTGLTEHQRRYLVRKVSQACRARCVKEIADRFYCSAEEASRKLTEAGDPFQI